MVYRTCNTPIHQYTKRLIVSPVITVHTLRKKEEIKTLYQSSQNSLAPWSLEAA